MPVVQFAKQPLPKQHAPAPGQPYQGGGLAGQVHAGKVLCHPNYVPTRGPGGYKLFALAAAPEYVDCKACQKALKKAGA